MKKYKLICMAFDGKYKEENPVFDSIEKAWEYANDLRSKWFFYPFSFVVSESGKTVIDAGYGLTHLEGKRVKTVQRIFKELSEKPEMEKANSEEFWMAL